uniref:U1-poneritoxin-Ng3e n=1 Tax=Neoponera goeldii TaxID=3057131 RepID=GTX3E_NEOGO|nr:RecName: Full=U1-poneritoxin-Ng3e; Short=U1-PONTX-Ng3e; AltName: Full=Poneratoxin; AltName: Full=Ponericin-G5 [Neoponera goeldii]
GLKDWVKIAGGWLKKKGPGILKAAMAAATQ